MVGGENSMWLTYESKTDYFTLTNSPFIIS
jgi:hypothetical protein